VMSRRSVSSTVGLLCVVWGTLLAQVPVSLPNLSARGGSELKIPVNVGDLSGLAVTSFEFVVQCDTNVVRLSGIDQERTLSVGLMMFANNRVRPFGPGKMKVVCASAKPIVGSGVLVYLKATTSNAGLRTPLKLSNVIFNAGTPATSVTNGSVKVSGRSAAASTKAKTAGWGDTLHPKK